MANDDTNPNDFGGPFVWPPDTRDDFEAFLRRWEPLALNVCRYFRLQADDQDEVMQRVRITLLRHRRESTSFDTNERFAAFVRRTAHGDCLNVILRRRVTVELPVNLPEASDSDEFAEYYPIGLPPNQRVQWLVGQAIEADRELLRLRFVEGLEFAEIGRRLGCSKTTAFERYTKAINQLRRRLTDDTN